MENFQMEEKHLRNFPKYFLNFHIQTILHSKENKKIAHILRNSKT